mgnify:FL=1
MGHHHSVGRFGVLEDLAVFTVLSVLLSFQLEQGAVDLANVASGFLRELFFGVVGERLHILEKQVAEVDTSVELNLVRVLSSGLCSVSGSVCHLPNLITNNLI